jgi:hypothetical protein
VSEDLLKLKIEALEAENARLREILKDCYMAGCNGDESAIGCMLADALESLVTSLMMRVV